MEIIKIGGGKRLDVCCNMLSESFRAEEGRIAVLPIPTTRDGIYVNGTEVALDTLAERVTEGTLVAGYGIPEVISQMIRASGGRIYDAAEDEIFLSENAKITAHGALGRLLTETDRDLGESFIGVLGYGRIGSALAELLMFLGARVRIYSTDGEKLISLAAAGAEARLAEADAEVFDLDALVNTAPASILSAATVARALDTGVSVIELASGRNFSDERVRSMPSIPDRMYPLSAGRLYAKRIASAFAKNFG